MEITKDTIIDEVLDATKRSARDRAVLNAAAVVFVSGIVSDLEKGITRTTTPMDKGSVAAKLQQRIRETNSRGDS
jgi:anthranilate phosphoribosyltransferase